MLVQLFRNGREKLRFPKPGSDRSCHQILSVKNLLQFSSHDEMTRGSCSCCVRVPEPDLVHPTREKSFSGSIHATV